MYHFKHCLRAEIVSELLCLHKTVEEPAQATAQHNSRPCPNDAHPTTTGLLSTFSNFSATIMRNSSKSAGLLLAAADTRRAAKRRQSGGTAWRAAAEQIAARTPIHAARSRCNLRTVHKPFWNNEGAFRKEMP